MYTPNIMTLVVIALYLLPAIVATFRKHHNTTAISVLNVLLGWTVLGWIGSLVWASTNPACNTRERT
ncbi:uncharacterized membrane protein YqaE (UPF0057 family) [Paraburkholderia sp. CI2]|uniref:superinfection immunity protein n=1 Tax=Paraburkholderia sp. CI2 TaxID=2723093 RepID=UPI00161B2621|nr:superinfection immunity protein [Paraburkholderia sp. CI2]MBB5469386.1 uncharacterized membrane protein YqaE (UPF0057 family) [Paraburkholderia sp. CI2]